MPYIVTFPPTVEPVTLAEAKAQIRVLEGELSEDGLISAYIIAARDYAESVTGLSLMQQTIEEYFDRWQCHFNLSKTPVSEISKVEYIPEGETDYDTWDDTNYYEDLVSAPARVMKSVDSSFPALARRPNPIRITYKAGNADAASVSGTIKQAMLLLIASFYENREDGDNTLVTTDQRVQTADKLLRINRLTF